MRDDYSRSARQLIFTEFQPHVLSVPLEILRPQSTLSFLLSFSPVALSFLSCGLHNYQNKLAPAHELSVKHITIITDMHALTYNIILPDSKDPNYTIQGTWCRIQCSWYSLILSTFAQSVSLRNTTSGSQPCHPQYTPLCK